VTAAPQPWDLAGSIRVARVDGVEWPYIDSKARAPVLLMLPGSVGTCEMFFKQLAGLGRELRIISVSYPAEPDPERLADGLARFVDGLGLERASILGSSFAGYWVQFFALRHPHRVESLFLGNAFIVPNELFSNPLFAPDFVLGTPAPELQRFWYQRVQAAPESELKNIQLAMLAGRQSAENLKARFVGMVNARRCPDLPIPTSHIVVIDCEDDPIIPPRTRAAVAKQYPGAEVHRLSFGGHYPHILNPDGYNRILHDRLLRR
jgi:maspardin